MIALWPAGSDSPNTVSIMQSHYADFGFRERARRYYFSTRRRREGHGAALYITTPPQTIFQYEDAPLCSLILYYAILNYFKLHLNNDA